MKFDQLREYNKKNIFLEKPNAMCGRETIPKQSISVDQQTKA